LFCEFSSPLSHGICAGIAQILQENSLRQERNERGGAAVCSVVRKNEKKKYRRKKEKEGM